MEYIGCWAAGRHRRRHYAGDVLDIGLSEMGVHRQRQLQARPALGRRTVIAAAREGWRKRERLLVVDAGLDAGLPSFAASASRSSAMIGNR